MVPPPAAVRRVGGRTKMVRPQTTLLQCSNWACAGCIPLHVAVHKQATGTPAHCRICDKRYKIPPGAERNVQKRPPQAAPSANPKDLAAQLKQKESQIKQLQQKCNSLQNGVDKAPPEGGDLPPDEKLSEQIPKRQNYVNSLEELGRDATQAKLELQQAKDARDAARDATDIPGIER